MRHDASAAGRVHLSAQHHAFQQAIQAAAGLSGGRCSALVDLGLITPMALILCCRVSSAGNQGLPRVVEKCPIPPSHLLRSLISGGYSAGEGGEVMGEMWIQAMSGIFQ